MTLLRYTTYFLYVAMISVAAAGPADDLVAAVAKGDFDTVLQQVGHGTPPNDANTKGQLPLVLAGAFTGKPACGAVRGNRVRNH